MDSTTASRIAKRFVLLALEKRRQYLLKMREEGLSLASLPIPRVREEFVRLPLSYAQQRQWFLWQFDRQSSAYHIPCALRLRGRLDQAALQASLEQLVRRHDSLRTRFVEDELGVAQQVAAAEHLPLKVTTLDEAALQDYIQDRVREPFDLASGALLRAELLQLGSDDHVLLLVQHHIVSDGRSMHVMVKELTHGYAHFSQGLHSPLAELPLQYADYAIWQRHWMEAGEQERQLDYWRQRLGNEVPVLELPLDRPRPSVQRFEGARLPLAISPDLAQAVRRLAQARQATPFMVLLASFMALLHRYTRQQDIRIGVPSANRNRVEVEDLIGYFVNTLVIDGQCQPTLSFNQLLDQVKATTLQAQAHQDLPFEQLVEALQPERNLSHNPLFQVMFNHQVGAPQQQAPSDHGLDIEPLTLAGETAQLDLTLNTHEDAQGLGASLTYATALFDHATVERLGQHWLRLLEHLVTAPDQAIGEADLLATDERQQLLEQWNDTAHNYPQTPSIHALFEAQARRSPDASALLFGEATLTYAQLNCQANQLAHALIAQGVRQDTPVGIAAERSLELVVGLLAILKAGGAYVPLDPEYPAERLSYMFEDSGIGLLLTQSHLRESLPLPAGLPVLLLDTAQTAQPEHDPQLPCTPEQLAYVIYTSGSTGRPKGAGNSHHALANRLQWMQAAYGLDASDTVLQKTPFSFDVSVWEFFWPLITGARLAIASPGDHRDPARLVRLIHQHRVTTLHFVPSMLQAFLLDDQVASCSSLQRIVCSGEALPVEAQQQVFARLPGASLYNLYGPTEAAIDVTHWTCRDEGATAVPIGTPIDNLACWILDAGLQPQPAGVIGELYLGGEGLARGYHQRPALTAERFVACPFHPGARMYRTGDLARYRADGVIEYCGRIDHQVKIRGLRIELGEIEARLMEQPAVHEAAVLAVDNQLVAYLVAKAGQPAPQRQQLTQALLAHLPDYMVPNHWLFLDSMPLSPNGKLDRKALPKPGMAQSQARYRAAENELQARLVQLWQRVLKRDQVGVDDNFFELGGDSIVSIQLVSQGRRDGLHFSPKDLFSHQTVRTLAQVAQTQVQQAQATHLPARGNSLLLPMQQQFFAQAMPEAQRWNQSVMLKANLAPEPAHLRRALHALVVAHDALRLRFQAAQGEWQAHFDEQAPGDDLLWQFDARQGETWQALCDRAQGSLDLTHGPLLRAVQGEVEGEQRLLLVIHHLAVDGVSWRILLEDLHSAYTQASAGQACELPARTLSVQDWALRLQAHAQSPAGEQEAAFWQGQSSGIDTTLPARDSRAPLRVRDSQSVATHLDADTTARLLKDCPAAYRTQINDLLLAALARVLQRWTGARDHLVELEGHGREAFADDEADLTRTVGWLTSLYPARISAGDSLAEAIMLTKEHLRALPAKGAFFGALRRYASPALREALAVLPAARITFNYLGQFDSGNGDEAALFRPTPADKGREHSPDAPLQNWLALNGQVFDGELRLNWSFSPLMFEPAQLQQLADDYARELRAVVALCGQGTRRGLTPSDVPLARLTQAQLALLPFPCEQVEDIYPLSTVQQGMLFHTQDNGGGDFYINQTSVEVQGLQAPRFIAAWGQLVQRHEMLRSAFWQAPQLREPLQVVLRQGQLDAREQDWRGQAVDPARLAAAAEGERRRPFDLLAPPLLRLLLVRLDDERHQLILTSHHILMDGWSQSRLLGELFQCYAGQPLPPQQGHYSDYIRWLQAPAQQTSEAFWRPRLAELQGPTQLAGAAGTRNASGAQGHDALYLHWDEQRTTWLREQAQRLRVTPNTLVQAAWVLMLQRYTGQPTVCFGATVSGRPASLAGADSLLGLFINTLPIIQAPHPAQPVQVWLQHLQTCNLEVRDHEHTPLVDIQRWAESNGQALFDSIIVFENYPIDERLQSAGSAGLQFGEAQLRDVTNYPMDLAVHLNTRLRIEFLYRLDHFQAHQVEAIRSHFESLLERLLANPEAAVGTLGLPVDAARQLPPETAEQPDLAALIGRHAEQRPNQVAVRCDGRQLTYAELEQQANRLAWSLIERGIGREDRVGIALGRSVDTLVAFYAAMKAGAAYVPLDIDYPAERLQWIIGDADVALLLTEQAIGERLGVAPARRLDLDHCALSLKDHDPGRQALDDQLSYMIYTSGSTGNPKGVAVARGPLRMHCQAIIERYEMNPSTRELLFMSFAFDGAQERWLSTLISGGQLVIRGNTLWTPQETWDVLHAEAISIACFPPAYLQQLAEYGQGQPTPPPVRIYCFGGDAVADANFERVKQVLKPQYLTNGYGPTETVVTPLLWKAPVSAHCDAVYAPIGEAVGNRTLYVLDDCLNPLPVGFAGELYIGGEGLARGYHNRPGLSAERFVADPFSTRGGRLYRTGDLVRQRPDGVFDYLGRLDNQVKIRGFRIELGEIEARLRDFPGVLDAVVVAREAATGKQLVGYVVRSEGERATAPLLDHLRQVLPDYMVPAQLMVLDALPLTPNGKVDRRALPEPSLAERSYQAPADERQQALATIWADVLGLEQVGVTDHFFELGGDSLGVLKVLSRLRNQPELGLNLKLRDLIARPTIAELCPASDQPQAALDPLLLLNRKVEQQAPLFCLHAGFGTVFDYRPLAQRLDGLCSVYGLQNRMLLDRQWQDESLEAMAIDYAQYIRQKQPQGPYRLLGWSLGGTLAMLVSRELESQGQQVELLGLVDTYLPGEACEALEEDCGGDLRAFLAVVSGRPAASLPLLSAPADAEAEQLQRLIEQSLAGVEASSLPSSEELARTFTAAMTLKRLSLKLHALPAVAARLDCWWADSGDAGPAQAFEANRAVRSSQRLDADHYAIVSHAALLDVLHERLHRVTAPAL
ncbi:amino acid adenylation domain-containing protein [Pseudomonas sp. NPDC089396]|uniref:amino acid adenylation domain-containing protein n=1 Tax=Pseudomonas sp. NPDC089396 TaxID=3364461 RepID=UPI00383613A2